jgi:hypothetical protein
MGNDKLDQQYIINLTKQLFGTGTLSRLAADRCWHPDATYVFFFEMLNSKLCAMNPETLGRICAYAQSKNYSVPLALSQGFIRKTGIEQVHPHPFDPKPGYTLLVDIAIATVVSVACDIMRQSYYEEEREREQENDGLFDLGMREYIHRGSKARQL